LSRPILPGASIGIFGGGQLGRMTAMAARSLGYGIQVIDPDPACPARGVVDRCWTAKLDDPEAAARLGQECQVLTFEIEEVGAESLAAGRLHAPVRPAAAVLEIVQDRARQKDWLAAQGFPVGAYRVARTEPELASALAALQAATVVKATRGGYDGRSQLRLATWDAAAAHEAWVGLGGRPCVAERRLDLEHEISVLVARRPNGQLSVFPPALNHHEQGILAWSVIPAPLETTLLSEAQDLAAAIAQAIAVEGLLAVEMFVPRAGGLLVNELAPRPHNTFHATERACVTSQFEQLVRAICDLPLGAVDVVRPAAIVNMFGDLWMGAQPPAFDRVLALPGIKLHLYGKEEARPRRKMGHLSAIGASPQAALAAVQAAWERLAASTRAGS